MAENEYEARKKIIDELREKKTEPFAYTFNRKQTVNELIEKYSKIKPDEKVEKAKVKIAGRIRSVREHGKAIFADLEDFSGRIQFYVGFEQVGEKQFELFQKFIGIGDIIGIEGFIFKTKKGELSIWAEKFQLLTKSLRGLPPSWFGLKDTETRYRQRYLDLIMNPEIKDMIIKKSIFWNSMREFLLKRKFVEVETPVFENATGGADAKPFVTHHNALDIEVYLRISAGELWQKRLMVAGFEKIFEIGRIFRNEGISPEHAQDYTQMEFYLAYADYEMAMKLVEEMYKYVIKSTFGSLKFKINGFDIDLNKKWERYDYKEIIKKYTGINIETTTLKEVANKLNELGIEYEKVGFNLERGIDNILKYCRKKIAGPGFLINHPVIVSPLAKRKRDNPNLTERFQVIIAGSELGNGYSELNDPIDQAKRFEEQEKLRKAGDEEAQMFDHDFVEALEYGMPPTAGFGVSERLFSFLMNKPIRECQIFPLLKPKETAEKKELFGNEIKDTLVKKEEKLSEPKISRADALELVKKYNKEKSNLNHYLESEAIMRALARKLKEDEEIWGLLGLLHDVDWELAKDNPKEHCIKAVEILKEARFSDEFIETIQSHAYGHGWDTKKFYGAEELREKERKTKAQHALAAAETVTGLIHAYALMRGGIKGMEVKGLKKKFKDKTFASTVNREIIKECEKIGLALDEFLELSIKAIQEIAKDVELG